MHFYNARSFAKYNRRTMAHNNLALAALFFAAFSAGATTITTTSGFLSSYTGTQGQDLNIASAEAFFDGTNYNFTSTLDAPIGTTSNVFYVWGVDRGLLSPSNEAIFGAFRPGVLFDAVVILQDMGGTGSGFIVDFAHGGAMTALPAGDVTFSGDTIKAFVPGADLTSAVLNGSQYQVNLWTRQGLNASDNTQIAEFAPSNMDAPITVTPEPAGESVLALGIVGLAASALRRKLA